MRKRLGLCCGAKERKQRRPMRSFDRKGKAKTKTPPGGAALRLFFDDG
jgi:hypothetical protein